MYSAFRGIVLYGVIYGKANHLRNSVLFLALSTVHSSRFVGCYCTTQWPKSSRVKSEPLTS